MDFIIHLFIHLLAYSYIAHGLSTLLMDLALIHKNNYSYILISCMLFIFIHDKKDPYRSSEGFPISHSYCKSQDFNWSLLALNQVIFFVIPLKICWFVVPSVNIT